MSMALISTVTVGAGGAASIDFNAIAGTFTDLVVLVSARNVATTNPTVEIKLNSASATASEKYIYGDGASASGGNNTALYGVVDYNPNTASTFGNMQIYIPNYAGTTAKVVSVDAVTESNATAAVQKLTTSIFGSSAVTSVNIISANGNFAQYSSASLYGIIKGSGGASVA